MKKEFRPYSATDLVLNLHSRISKSNMTKILEELVEDEEICVKSYGKNSFYFYKAISFDSNYKTECEAKREMNKLLKEESEILENELTEVNKSLCLHISKFLIK